MTTPESKALQITFDPEAADALRRMKTAVGVDSIAEMVQRALGLYEWALAKADAGFTITAISRDGKDPSVEIDPYRWTLPPND